MRRSVIARQGKRRILTLQVIRRNKTAIEWPLRVPIRRFVVVAVRRCDAMENLGSCRAFVEELDMTFKARLAVCTCL